MVIRDLWTTEFEHEFGVIRPPFVIMLLFYTIWFNARSIPPSRSFLSLMKRDLPSSWNCETRVSVLISQYNWKDSMKSRDIFFFFWKRNYSEFFNQIEFRWWFMSKKIFLNNENFYYQFIHLSRKIFPLKFLFSKFESFFT